MISLESTSNCILGSERTGPGKTITGVGVLLSFILTAVASNLFSNIIIWGEPR
ncbi:hypothetical protein EPUL_006357, partial [Erysiphe pulchra]